MILIVYYLFLCSVFLLCVLSIDRYGICETCVQSCACVCMLQTVAVHTMTSITTKQQQLRPTAYLPGHCTTPLKLHILMKLAKGAAWKQSQSCHSVQRLSDNYCRSWITSSHTLKKKKKVACGAILALQPVGRLYPCPNEFPSFITRGTMHHIGTRDLCQQRKELYKEFC